MWECGTYGASCGHDSTLDNNFTYEFILRLSPLGMNTPFPKMPCSVVGLLAKAHHLFKTNYVRTYVPREMIEELSLPHFGNDPQLTHGHIYTFHKN